MRGMRNYLFNEFDLSAKLDERRANLLGEIESFEKNRLLNTSPSDLANYYVDRYKIEPLVLLRDQMTVESSETRVDVRYDPNRMIFDHSRPVFVPGQRVSVHVPYSGDPSLFRAKANEWDTMPPHAELDREKIVLNFESPHDVETNLRPKLEDCLSRIEIYIRFQHLQLVQYNGLLHVWASSAIEDRRNRILKAAHTLEALGIPIRVCNEAPKTYSVPNVRRSAAPVLPAATSKPYAPEPAWALEHYEHALKVMTNMTQVMERSPGAFAKMKEEDLRQHFLVQLNAQFEGKATGETFNMSGKTDILLRHGDRNVFIAECKFWKGQKHFSEAIDQLLSYATWRDTKTVILVFNRKGALSKTLESIPSTVIAHPNYKKNHVWPHETGFRYTFCSKEDANRELLITVLVFNIPV